MNEYEEYDEYDECDDYYYYTTTPDIFEEEYANQEWLVFCEEVGRDTYK